MAVQINAPPESGFDNPLGMLADCHRRIEHFLHILCTVASRAKNRALTVEEISAIEAALNYFRIGGSRHTADEEESVFPRLRQKGAATLPCDIAALEQDHQNADRLHAKVEALYGQWIRRGSLDADGHRSLSASTEELDRLYKRHIRIEEEVVFPHAANTFDHATIDAIGQEFRKRRA